MQQVTPNDVYVSSCRPGNPELSGGHRPRLRFRQPADAGDAPADSDVIVIGQKSGIGFAMDPDRRTAR